MADARRHPADRPEAAQAHTSFLAYRGGRFLWIALGLCVASALLYAWHDPIEGRSGSTWLGYSLGILGVALIAWLAWLGVRKRQFQTGRGALVAWVSAHVYLGLSLLVIGTLHAAFQLGWNVHSLAWLLMVLVIVSGVYGVIAYAVLPSGITAGRNQMEFREMVEQFDDLNETLLVLADHIDPETHAIVTRSVSRSRIGGSAWQQLSGRYPKPGEQGMLERLLSPGRTADAPANPTLSLLTTAGTAQSSTTTSSPTMMVMARRIFAGRTADRGEDIQKLLQTLGRRNALRDRINRDITRRARMTVWLYVHVPLTVALLAALLVHVLAVFLYW